MSAPASTSKPSEVGSTTTGQTAPTQQQAAALPTLNALDEDDEFEEFEAQDWTDAETDLSSLKAAALGAAALSMGGVGGAATGDALWEDNWDDDDVEDDFSRALRAELQKTSTAMAT